MSHNIAINIMYLQLLPGICVCASRSSLLAASPSSSDIIAIMIEMVQMELARDWAGSVCVPHQTRSKIWNF